MSTSAALAIPSHVPPELVRDFPYSFGKSTHEDPFGEMVAAIHRGPEIFYVADLFPDGGGWVPRRQEDLRSIYQDTEHFSTQNTTPFSLMERSWRVLPLESDPPIHSEYRAAINPFFSPKTISQLDDKIRLYARQSVAALAQLGAIDFLHDFAFEFPIKVFLELMGLPQARLKQYLDWTAELMHAPDIGTLIKATTFVINDLRVAIEDHKQRPQEDIISYCLNAQMGGGRALTDDEVLSLCFNLFLGGLDTVSTNLTWQILYLARNPAQQHLLRANPAMIPDAIEEFMRAFASVMTTRVCIKETAIRGLRIIPGDRIALSTTIAARDPAVYDQPDEIILDRKPKHVSFGFGPHLCVGMHLARREMKIALEAFLDGIPEFRLKPGVEILSYLNGVMQPERLMIEWTV